MKAIIIILCFIFAACNQFITEKPKYERCNSGFWSTICYKINGKCKCYYWTLPNQCENKGCIFDPPIGCVCDKKSSSSNSTA